MLVARHAQLFTIIGEGENGTVLTSAGGAFDTLTYSRFKYGCTQAADLYGQLLTGTILGCDAFHTAQHHPDQVIVTASAYKHLPTAAQAVTDSAVKTLRGHGYPIQMGRIHRDALTEGDYGNMNAVERTYWMSRNGLWVHEADFVGRDVIVIDDVSISGAHGRAILRMFQSVDVASVTLVHVLKLDAELAAHDPTIENRMNHAVIKNLSDLGNLIRQRLECYVPNARMVKFMLSHSAQEIVSFLDTLPTELIEKICRGIRLDKYDQMPLYVCSAEVVAKYLVNRHAAIVPQLQIA